MLREALSQINRRDAHPLVQFAKYGVAGVLATGVDVLVFYAAAVWLLPALGPSDPAARLLGLTVAPIADAARSTNYVWDKVASFMVANFAAYVINVAWVFTPGRHSRAVELGLFYAVSGLSFVVGTGIAWLLIRRLDMPTTYAYGINAVASMLINYALRKFVVFKG
ncbi:MAG: GtrA family protein [Proteobacteria bacterium]|nr:GtrA family protein [Pseudomonadota bacterium]